MSIKIDPEFKALIPPLTESERFQLEENLKKDGCRDPLVVWDGWLIDGHNRHEICERMGIDYQVDEIDLPDKAAALDWIDANQLGRRNLTPEQMSLLRGRIYNRSKKPAGGREGRSFSDGQNVQPKPTHETLGEKFGVSGKTVQRDGKFAEQVESMDKAVPGYAQGVISGEYKRKDVADIAKAVESIPEDERTPEAIQETVKKHVHVSANSGNNEWYTPPEIIEMARQAMGGIDTDPATSEFANQNVKAELFYTEQDDGRDEPWAGRVWMNPPYSHGLMADFAEAVTAKYASGEIEQACVLVNNATETGWFQRMLDEASAVLLIKGRVRYLDSQGNRQNTPLQGQAIVYFGNDVESFQRSFSSMGKVLING